MIDLIFSKTKQLELFLIHLMNQLLALSCKCETLKEGMPLMAINNKLDGTLEPTYVLYPLISRDTVRIYAHQHRTIISGTQAHIGLR